MPRPGDEDLAQMAQNGSSEAFSELSRRYYPRILGYLRRRLRSEQDAEDLAQETLTRCLDQLDRYRPEHPFVAWIFTVTRNILISHFRREGLRRSEPLPEGGIPTEAPEGVWNNQEDMARLWDLATQLPAAQFEALWLRYTEDLSVEEIAEVMGRSRISIRVMLHRSRQKLLVLCGAQEELEQRGSPARRFT